MQTFLKNRESVSFFEKRFIYDEGGPDQQIKKTVEAKIEDRKTEVDDLRSRFQKGEAEGKDVAEMAKDIASESIEDDEELVSKKTEVFIATMDSLARKFGVRTDLTDEIKSAKETCKKAKEEAKKDLDDRLEDLFSDDEKYVENIDHAKKSSDSRVNWISPDDIKNAPDGSRTKKAHDKWEKTNNELDAKKGELATAKNKTDHSDDISAALHAGNVKKLEGEVAKLEKQLAKNVDEIEVAIREDYDAAVKNPNHDKNIESAFVEAFNDNQDLKALNRKYEGKLPDKFDPNAKLDTYKLKGKALSNYNSVFKMIPKNTEEPLNNWEDLLDKVGKNKDKFSVATDPDVQKRIIATFNEAIVANNAIKYCEKRDKILSETEKKDIGSEKKDEKKDAVSEKKDKKYSFLEFNIKENPKTNSKVELNENGAGILNLLKEIYGEEGLKTQFGIEASNMLNIHEGKGFVGILQLQKSDKFKNLNSDSYAGPKTTKAVKDFLTKEGKLK